MVCFKKEFKSRTKIGKFNTKREEFYVYGWKYSKTTKEFIYVLTKKSLIKFIKEFPFFQENIVSAVVLKTVLFVKDLNLFIKKIYLWKIYSKTNKYGFELKHII